MTRVLDITAALERRKRAGRWTARLDADGSLVIVGHDDQGDEDIRLTWPAKARAWTTKEVTQAIANAEALLDPDSDRCLRTLPTRRLGS